MNPNSKKALSILIISHMLFIFFLFCYKPQFTMEIQTNMPEGTAYTIKYLDRSSKLPQLLDYDIMQESILVNSNGKIILQKIPPASSELQITGDTQGDLLISEAQVKYFHIPVKNISAADFVKDSGNFITINTGINIILNISIILLVIFSLLLSCIIIKHITIFKDYLYFGALIISPMMSYAVFEIINENFWFIDLEYRFINYCILLLFYLIVYIIIQQPIITIFACNMAVFILGIANYFVLLYRGKPIMPWDFYAFSTALSVVNSYKFFLNASMLWGLFLIIMQAFLFLKASTYIIAPKKKHSRFFAILLALIVMGGTACSKTLYSLQISYWDTDIVYYYKTQGTLASFYKYGQESQVKKPEGYDPERFNNIERYLISNEDTRQAIRPKNIIMVMNESFTDFQSISGVDVGDTLSYYSSLLPSSTYGNLYVSVRGGGTCNTEYEVLTGNSLVFLPGGAFPFETYIKEPTSSLVSDLKDDGYKTIALHLEQSKNWNRNKVYPLIGFEDFYDINDFTEIETVRARATDYYNYKKVIELYEENKDSNLYIFNTSIQNHGGYSGFGDLDKTIDLSKYGEYENAEVYFSLLKLSDQALKMLIQYFESVEEPTMIIMFGDHQPQLDERSDQFLLGEENIDSGSKRLNKYITPFMIWKNYDNKSCYIEKLSANYLPCVIKQEAALPLSDYDRFLLKLKQDYPVITTQGIIDADDNYYENIDALPENDMIDLYEQWEYKNMFQSENKVAS